MEHLGNISHWNLPLSMICAYEVRKLHILSDSAGRSKPQFVKATGFKGQWQQWQLMLPPLSNQTSIVTGIRSAVFRGASASKQQRRHGNVVVRFTLAPMKELKITEESVVSPNVQLVLPRESKTHRELEHLDVVKFSRFKVQTSRAQQDKDRSTSKNQAPTLPVSRNSCRGPGQVSCVTWQRLGFTKLPAWPKPQVDPVVWEDHLKLRKCKHFPGSCIFSQVFNAKSP